MSENWYRTEVLIFVREDADSRLVEQWDPLPTLEYPQEYRYLLDPAVADRRLQESQAYSSAVDDRGVQTLLVPAPIEELQDHSRPDALTTPLVELDVLIPDETATEGDPGTAVNALLTKEPARNTELTPQTPDDAANLQPDPNDPQPDLETPIIALPYELLDDDNLEFRPQARSLRRQGHRLVFHGSWWAMLDDADETPSLIMDRSGDMDSLDWPALQGSLQVYRSRYLHIALDLWLNTRGEYLPDGWQIDPPPLPAPSLSAQTLRGSKINPWSPDISSPGITLDEIGSDTVSLPNPEASPDPDLMPSPIPGMTQEITDATDYPWHHAIVHRQSRRMRSGEIHYLDHPVIGVIVKVTPMSDDALPLLEPGKREFRERHGLAIEFAPVDDASAKEQP
ncbi:conserved hypothetical protein [gamma proteobacterium NOR5-3]|nr:conserved hypothetical protein [gamma proteobacterium NOR5-3]